MRNRDRRRTRLVPGRPYGENALNDTTRIFRRRPRILSALLTVLVASLLIAAPALAFPPGLDHGQRGPVQPDRRGAEARHPAPDLILNNPTTGAAPVEGACTETGGYKPVTVSWVSDTPSGNATDNAWGQGDKSDCYLAKTGGVAGACVTQVYGIGAAKTDLQYHGIGLEKGSDGHDYLYSGIKRLQAGGITSSNGTTATSRSHSLGVRLFDACRVRDAVASTIQHDDVGSVRNALKWSNFMGSLHPRSVQWTEPNAGYCRRYTR